MMRVGWVWTDDNGAAPAATTGTYPGWQAVILHRAMHLLAIVLGATWRA